MTNDITGSLLLDAYGVTECFPPPIDLIAEQRVQDLVRTAISKGLVTSALDVRRGGLLITLAECFAGVGRGIVGAPPASWGDLSTAAMLFGEAQSRFVVSLDQSQLEALKDEASALGVPLEVLGTVKGDEIHLRDLVRMPLAVFKQ